MSAGADGAPERLGRLLGRVVVRGRIAARQLSDPTTREQFARVGRRAAEQAQPKVQEAATRVREEFSARGPDVAEQIAQRAVDRIFWGFGGRSGVLITAIRPLVPSVRNAAGTLARDLAKAAGGREEPAPPSPTDIAPGALPEAGEQGERPPGRGEPRPPTA